MARRILVLGATSAIAHAYARCRAAEGASFVLAGRRTDFLEANAADLRARGASSAEIVTADLGFIPGIGATAALCHANFAFFDEILLAYGVLGQQSRAETDLDFARSIIDLNFTSVALWLLQLTKTSMADHPMTVIVIGSVAGDRGRKSNFVYGAAKGGLERFVEGLQHAYAASSVRIILIKPGFVDTPMTEGVHNKGGPLWARPEAVAHDIVKAAKSNRVVVYTPWFWYFIMMIIRFLPRAIFNRVNI
jgi:decaprenylphospho-beta-D-erythro-pentofuranosid-2-ulose 2-reductase